MVEGKVSSPPILSRWEDCQVQGGRQYTASAVPEPAILQVIRRCLPYRLARNKKGVAVTVGLQGTGFQSAQVAQLSELHQQTPALSVL